MLLEVIATIAVTAPFVLAAVVDYQIRQFQHEAFGHLRRAARNLRFMAWFILAYYVAVLLGSWIVGDLAAIVTTPMSAAGYVIYARIGAAIGAYAFALFVARELYLVTRPGKMVPGAPEMDLR